MCPMLAQNVKQSSRCNSCKQHQKRTAHKVIHVCARPAQAPELQEHAACIFPSWQKAWVRPPSTYGLMGDVQWEAFGMASDLSSGLSSGVRMASASDWQQAPE